LTKKDFLHKLVQNLASINVDLHNFSARRDFFPYGFCYNY
jgi:hypothetical protein